MLRTKIALITAAILCTAVAHAGSITIGNGNAGSSSASTSNGIAGAFTIGTGIHGATTTNASAGNAVSGAVVTPSSIVTQSTTSSTSQNGIFCNYWATGWRQMVYTSAELSAAGLTAGNITSLTFNNAK